MANITITVQSLLNTAVYNSYTIDNAQTVAQLKTAINTARSFDSSWYDIVLNETLLADASTLASLSIITGTILRTHNKINRLATRQLRQEAKLALAILDRAASSKRSTLTINDLPTKYSGDTIVDNPNTGGLVVGRPWS
jgi:sirohydrochlorin ferrochelatase